MNNKYNLILTIDIAQFKSSLSSSLNLLGGFKADTDKILSGVKFTADNSELEKEFTRAKKIFDEFPDQKDVVFDADGKTAKTTAKEVSTEVQKVPKEKKTEFKATAKNAISVISQLSMAYMGIAKVLGQITGLVGKYVTASNVQELAEQKLASTLKIKGEYTDESFEAMKKYASSIQEVTTVGDEQSLKLMAQAVNFGISTDKMNEATKGSIGLAEKFADAGLSQETALKGIALAMEGDFNQLQRYIPALKSAGSESEKMAILQQEMGDGFELAEEKTKTGAGAITQFDNLVGDLKEGLGNLVKIGLVPLLGAITPIVKGMIELTSIFSQNTSEVEKVNGAYIEQSQEFEKNAYVLQNLISVEKKSEGQILAQKEALQELKAQYPSHFANLDTSTMKEEDLAKAIKNTREELAAKFAQELANAKISDKLKEQAELILESKELEQKRLEFQREREKLLGTEIDKSKGMYKLYTQNLEENRLKQAEITAEIEKQKETYKELLGVRESSVEPEEDKKGISKPEEKEDSSSAGLEIQKTVAEEEKNFISQLFETKRQTLDQELALIQEKEDRELEALQSKYEAELEANQDNLEAQKELQEDFEEEKTSIQEKNESLRASKRSAEAATQKAGYAQMTSDMKAFGKEGFEASKALAIAEATMNMPATAQKAYASVVGIEPFGPVLAPIAYAASIANSIKTIANISAQKFAKGGLVSGPSHAQGGVPMFSSGGQYVGEMEGEEYIISKEKTKELGVDYLNRLNFGSIAPKFRLGGMVQRLSYASGGTVPSVSTVGESDSESGTVTGLLEDLVIESIATRKAVEKMKITINGKEYSAAELATMNEKGQQQRITL